MAEYRFEVRSKIDEALSRELFDLYLETFGPLATLAAARHVLTPEEWADEMQDERIEKFLVVTDTDEVVGMMTSVLDLAAVPWISQEYFRERYGDRPVIYQGFTMIRKEHRSLELLLQLFHRGLATVPEDAVIAFDCSEYNAARGYVDRISLATGAEVQELDVQRYYMLERAETVLDLPSIEAQPTIDLRDSARVEESDRTA